MATKFNVAARPGVLFRTVDATPIVAVTFQTRPGKVYFFGLKASAIYDDFSAAATYWREAAFRTSATGTLTQVGATRTVVADNEDTAGMDIAVAASGTEIQVTVTGVAAQDIYWRFDADIIETDDLSVN